MLLLYALFFWGYVYSQRGKRTPRRVKKKKRPALTATPAVTGEAQPTTTTVTIDHHRKGDSKAKSSISAVKSYCELVYFN